MHYDKWDGRRQYFSKHVCFYRETIEIKHYLEVHFETDKCVSTQLNLSACVCIHVYVCAYVCVQGYMCAYICI